jgi:KGK domain
MLEHSYFSDFDDHDVIAFSEENLYKSKKLKSIISNLCPNSLEPSIIQYLQSYQIKTIGSWTKDGVFCEVLKLGSNQWQKGKIKIRVSVEFYPDEPEAKPSPLDEFR